VQTKIAATGDPEPSTRGGRPAIQGGIAVGRSHGAGQILLPIDLGWRNVVFSLRTAAASIVALAIAYWLHLDDPQWATLTVYLLAQPTVGAALSRGTWRALGTVCGGLVGLVIVALFSQTPELLVAATVTMIGMTFYLGARLRNSVSYGMLICGFTGLLVAYEGSVDPINAWSIAADRIGAILIGIGCVTMLGAVVFPRYASDALRDALSNMFRNLAGYAAAALRLSPSPGVFAELRGNLVRQVISFDALRSSAMFEGPDRLASARGLQRIVDQFLAVLSVGRGLFARRDVFDQEGGQAVDLRLRPALESIAQRLEKAGADPSIWRDPAQWRGDLREAHRDLDTAAADLEGMAGVAPFEPLANGVLILKRVGDLLDGLAIVVVAEAASLGAKGSNIGSPRIARDDFAEQREAMLVGVQAALAIGLLSLFWMATGWSEGFTAISGGIITLLLAVNQDNQQAVPRTFLIWSGAGIVLAYLTMIFALPHIEGFGALAVVLMAMLFLPGLMAGTPSRALAGVAFGAFAISQISTGNVFQPNEQAFVSNAIALLLGMLVCLTVIAATPVTSRARRERSWDRAIGTILPAVARGSVEPRRAAREIVAALAALLPRLAPYQQRDDDFFRGTLGAASSALELGRLIELRSDPNLPGDVAAALGRFLEQFASALEAVARDRAGRESALVKCEAIVTEMRAILSSLPLAPGPNARSMLRAGAALRFIADRFYIDRAYLGRGFYDGQ
jgi:uncharacterized membrane protein YccC